MEAAAKNPPEQPSAPGSPLAAELHGDLPCIVCRYNLRGLTIAGMCPECGTSLRATLLAVVDPMAKELRPLRSPTLVALGLATWTGAGLLAAMGTWVLRATDFVAAQGVDLQPLRYAIVALAGLSGLGSTALIAPHAGIPRSRRLATALGSLAALGLALVLYRLHVVHDAALLNPYREGAPPDEHRVVLRLLGSSLLIGSLVVLRPSARMLQERWLLMRVGAVGRQTLLAMAATILVWTIGDLILLALPPAMNAMGPSLPRGIAHGFILVGSLLFTIGAHGAAWDSLRVAAVIRRPPRSLEDLVLLPSPPGPTR